MNEEEQFYFDTDICRLGGMLLTLKVKPVLYLMRGDMTVICHDDSFISVTNVLLEPISATIGRQVGYTLVRLSLYPPVSVCS